MHKHAYFLLFFLGIVAVSFTPAYARESFRILTYNIRICRGMSNGPDISTDKIAQVIRNQNSDMVALQEVDRKTLRSAGRDLLQELADVTDLISSYGAARNLPGGTYGVGVLSKKTPKNTYHIPLPGEHEPRTLLICEFDTFVFFCTHLCSSSSESRMASAKIINQELVKFTKPVLFAGDLNSAPTSAVIREFEKSWKRLSPLLPTYPADEPKATLDYILVSKGAQAQASEVSVINEPSASDHRPVFVVVDFK